MALYTEQDFDHIKDHQSLDEVMCSGYGPAGEGGSPEFARNVADALTFADGDIFQDYGQGHGGFANEAALHANITAMQSAVMYARSVLEALADNPQLLESVNEAIAARAPMAPGA